MAAPIRGGHFRRQAAQLVTVRGKDKEKALFCARIMIYYWGVYGRAG